MKYAPYGIDESEQIEPYKKIIPERVQKLIDLYRKIILTILGMPRM